MGWSYEGVSASNFLRAALSAQAKGRNSEHRILEANSKLQRKWPKALLAPQTAVDRSESEASTLQTAHRRTLR